MNKPTRSIAFRDQKELEEELEKLVDEINSVSFSEINKMRLELNKPSTGPTLRLSPEPTKEPDSVWQMRHREEMIAISEQLHNQNKKIAELELTVNTLRLALVEVIEGLTEYVKSS